MQCFSIGFQVVIKTRQDKFLVQNFYQSKLSQVDSKNNCQSIQFNFCISHFKFSSKILTSYNFIPLQYHPSVLPTNNSPKTVVYRSQVAQFPVSQLKFHWHWLAQQTAAPNFLPVAPRSKVAQLCGLDRVLATLMPMPLTKPNLILSPSCSNEQS